MMRLLSLENASKRIFRLLVAVLLLGAWAFHFGAAHAANTDTLQDPLVFSLKGDLWAWTAPGAPLRQLTTWGQNKTPILSPDGTLIVYKSDSSIVTDWVKRDQVKGWSCDCELPSTIWLLDARTGDTQQLAFQPAGAIYNGPYEPGKFVMRSDPVWSPDGKMLAWSEFVISPGAARTGSVQVVLFDMQQRTTRVIVPSIKNATQNNYAPVSVMWSAAGIALVQANTENVGPSLLLYSPLGQLLANHPYPDVELLGQMWVQDGLQETICCTEVLTASGNEWDWFDPKLGIVSPLQGPLEIYSPGNPNGIRLTTDLSTDSKWMVKQPGQADSELGSPYDAPHNLAMTISRDGQQAAFVKSGNSNPILYVYSAGQTSEVGPIDDGTRPVWGPAAWRHSGGN